MFYLSSDCLGSCLQPQIHSGFVKRSPATLKKEVPINKHYIGYFDTPKKTNHAVLKRLKALAL